MFIGNLFFDSLNPGGNILPGFLLPGMENIFEFSGKSLDRWKYMFYNRMRGNFYLV